LHFYFKKRGFFIAKSGT